MVSLRQTSLKYRGQKAKTYDAIRTKQARWDFEHEVVRGWLAELKPSSVLDCPVGTGRFLPVYADLSTEFVTGVDISEEMLALARKKVPRKMKMYSDLKLVKCSATEIDAKNKFYDGSVCVRFLDLIDEEAMRAVMTELARVSKKWIICTIRLGDKYVPKSNTSEHNAKKFLALVRRLGFKVAEGEQFRGGSWHVFLLKR
jgi:ubiquinone/menaquinone biosynthesis C-methylase UbiE